MSSPSSNPTVQNDLKISDSIPVIFRYMILLAMYAMIFWFFRDKSARFILFIVIFIVIFFTIVFLGRDLIATGLVAAVYSPSSSLNLQESNSIYAKLFIGALFSTLLLQFSSIAIILAVFDYGKRTTNNYYTAKMNKQNEDMLSEYITWLLQYFVTTAIFAYFLAVSYTKNEKVKSILVNLGGMVAIGLLLGFSIKGTILSVKFLDIKKYRRALYE